MCIIARAFCVCLYVCVCGNVLNRIYNSCIFSKFVFLHYVLLGNLLLLLLFCSVLILIGYTYRIDVEIHF